MKTKLELGKEYWLDGCKDESGTFIGIDGNKLLFKPNSKNCKSYCLDESGYAIFGDTGRKYLEVAPANQFQFTTPIAMKCTEEQFNGIKDKLVEMGYRFYGITFGEKYRYLSSNFAKDKRCITDLAIGSKYFKECNPIIFETFNPDLFLALAAMTNNEDGIKGEWWIGNDSGKLFKQTIEKKLNTAGVIRKATAQEIIEHFEKKEFVLPEKWCVKITPCNFKLISRWRYNNTIYVGAYVVYDGYVDNTGYFSFDKAFSEITSEQFKKYVLKETEKSCPKKESVQIIPIPTSRQATIFDDRVEITDWKPKVGDKCFEIHTSIDGLVYAETKYSKFMNSLVSYRFIVRTESEAKQLVEKLKQAML